MLRPVGRPRLRLRLHGTGLRRHRHRPVTGTLTAASASGQLIFLPVLSWIVATYDWRPAALTVALAALAVVPFVRLLLHGHPADVGRKPYGVDEFVSRPAPVPGAARRTLAVLFSALPTLLIRRRADDSLTATA